MLSYKYKQNFTKYHSSETMQFVQVDKAPKVKNLKGTSSVLLNWEQNMIEENAVPHYGKPILPINLLFINISMWTYSS